MPSPFLIEVCANSIASAVAGQRGGAARVELCAALIEGGITPSAAAIELVREQVQIQLNVLIRPRGGDFCYDDGEFTAGHGKQGTAGQEAQEPASGLLTVAADRKSTRLNSSHRT